MKFYNWLKDHTDPKNIFAPPMEAQTAVDFLIDYLLGEDWCVVDPISTQQINTQAVFEILLKYSKKFRKERKKILEEDRRKENGI
jgi:hypothetical protein